jgi:hypothetical protein
MPPIEAGLALVRMTFDDLQDAAGYVCTERDFESANGDDEDDGAIPRLSRQAGKIGQDIAGLKRTTQLAELPRRVRESSSSTPEAGQPARAG